jgi:4-amino-4-deoxy-L-arabinose transferase-like glycosyltransferase
MNLTGPTTQRERLISTGLATLLAALVLLPLLGHKPLAEWDEGIYAEVSREMLGGSWLVPHWNGQLWFEKPPLMLWITAAFFKLFGASEFWARAGSAFSGIAIVSLLHGFLARTRDLLAAWLSSVSLLATFGFLHICHVGEMDTLLSFGICLALIGLSKLAGAPPSAVSSLRVGGAATDTSAWLLFWTGFAIALMTKGAASAVIPITAILFGIAQRWSWSRFNRAFAVGLLLFLALVLPWHIAMVHRFGRAFLDEYLGFHTLTRAVSQIEGHNTPWWFYFKVLLVSAPPFCLFYPIAIRRGLQRPELRAFAIFSLVVLVFFSVIQTRLPHYIAPVYPALALLTAVWIGEWLRHRRAQPRAYWLRTGVAVTVIWMISILATHSTLKSLHSASLAGGNLLDNRKADALLRSTRLPPMTGPLLLWRAGKVQSIATVVFYSQRQVQQVELGSPDPPGDRYMSDVQPLVEVVGPDPRLILLDKSLLPHIPAGLAYTPMRSSANLTLGVIGRTSR